MVAITALYASFMTMMLMVLSFHVIYLRFKLGIMVGDGGNEEMQKLIQARNNIVDYVPLALLLMFILEKYDMHPYVLHGLGVTLIISRLIQGLALTTCASASKGRIAGSMLIHAVLLVQIILCLAVFMYVNNYI